MNITSKYTKILVATAAVFFIAACSNSSGSGGSSVPAPVQPSEVDAQEGGSQDGTAIHESNVTSIETMSRVEGKTLEEIFAAFPVLSARASFLGTVTRVVETDAGTLNLYAGDSLVMVLQSNQGSNTYTVKSSTNEFEADSITRSMSSANGGEQEQETIAEKLNFVTSACRVEEQEQEQEQGGKEEDKQKEEPKQVEECAVIEIEMTFERVEEVKQEQEQKQEEEKQEQEKQEQEKQEQEQKQEQQQQQKQEEVKQEQQQKQQEDKKDGGQDQDGGDQDDGDQEGGQDA